MKSKREREREPGLHTLHIKSVWLRGSIIKWAWETLNIWCFIWEAVAVTLWEKKVFSVLFFAYQHNFRSQSLIISLYLVFSIFFFSIWIFIWITNALLMFFNFREFVKFMLAYESWWEFHFSESNYDFFESDFEFYFNF